MRKLWTVGLLTGVTLAAGAPARAAEADEIKRAVDRGVAALRGMQGTNGQWPHTHIGATALAGLTLLECGARPSDKAVQRAADAVRQEAIGLRYTYSIALSILFLDRLGDSSDVPLIESLMVRLLAGQTSMGGWSYDCPGLSATEMRRLQATLDRRKEGTGRREPPKTGTGKRTVKDLPEEIQRQLTQIEGGVVAEEAPLPGSLPGVAGGDNSNTQFATLALWVGRRHGLPVERALARVDARFRASQMDDGGWAYAANFFRPPMGWAGAGAPVRGDRPMMLPPGMGSMASMTCAGLMCLAIADGATMEIAQERKEAAKEGKETAKERKTRPKAAPDVSKDKNLLKGLLAISTVIGDPNDLRLQPGDGAPNFRPAAWQHVGGRTYYFLWSLERVGVALDLKTIGKKDWYSWGAEILLANQQPDGSWQGTYGAGGVDTCFALLFFKRANLADDLTGLLKGRLKDPGERLIRAGGVGGGSLRAGKGGMKSGIETKDAGLIDKPPLEARPVDSESARLAGDLVKASGSRRTKLLDQMRDGKGVKYTEALAAAIPHLVDEARSKARDALANRLTRMKAETLAEYLQDEDAEIRRAAALACAMKEDKTLVPNLIGLLRDPEMLVVRAAHAALKALTKQDFGPAAKASREERDQAALKWLSWWSNQKK
jgi:hypothetical protein